MPPHCHAILVVDDSPDIRTMLRIALERAGYGPSLVATGAAALLALAERPFALLLTDLHLPDMHGRELIEQAQRLPACPPVVVMSGALSDDGADPAPHPAAIASLLKPFALVELLSIIARVFAPKQADRCSS